MHPVSIELEAERQTLIATMSKWREEVRTLSQLLDTMRSALDAEEVRIIMAAGGYAGLGKNDAERKLAASQLLIANGSYQKAKSAVSAATADLAFAKDSHADATRQLNSLSYRMQLAAEEIRAYTASDEIERMTTVANGAGASFEPSF
jgi:hypothetical protein